MEKVKKEMGDLYGNLSVNPKQQDLADKLVDLFLNQTILFDQQLPQDDLNQKPDGNQKDMSVKY